MKPYLHPAPNLTQLQVKDGSTFALRWLYLRSRLRLEAPSPTWLTILNRAQRRSTTRSISPSSTFATSSSSSRSGPTPLQT